MDVLGWLMDSAPAIRWQVMRDLQRAPTEIWTLERTRIANEGWGARLLEIQDPDGQWDGGACFPGGPGKRPEDYFGQPWTSTLPVLQLLFEFGIDPRDARVQSAITGVREGCRWEHAGQPFFSGEVEPCINGRTVALGAYFGVDMTTLVELLLGEQLEDGGWNCEAERGSVRSSFATTINVLEGLRTFERVNGSSPALSEARRRGEEYLLQRRLFRRKSTGEIVETAWLRFSYPVYWHYDVLRALDYFRGAGGPRDERMGEAIELVRSRRQKDGRWLLENTHPGNVHFHMEGGDGEPSRWNTLRALRVLQWWDGGA